MTVGFGVCPIVALAVVVLLIVLAFRNHSVARALGWGLLVLLGVVVVMTVLSISIPAYQRYAEIRRREAVRVGTAAGSAVVGNIDWPAEAREGFEPDVYPSASAAALGAAVKLMGALDQDMPREGPKRPLVVTGNMDGDVLGRVALAIEEKMSFVPRVAREGAARGTTQAGDNQTILEIREVSLSAEEPRPSGPQSVSNPRWEIDDYKARITEYKDSIRRYKEQYKRDIEAYKAEVKRNPDVPVPVPVPQFQLPPMPVLGPGTVNGRWVQDAGRTLELTLRGPKGTVSRQVRYVNKAWADNFGEFVARDANKNWLIGRSPRPCASESEAHDQALTNAAGQLYPLLVDQIQSAGYRWPLRTFNARYEEATLVPFLRSQLKHEGLVRDRFIQHFSRPYGNVVREALLVDASPANILALTDAYRDGLTGARMGLKSTLLSLVGMVILICIVYAFVNAATRGYYTWSLRMAAVVIGGVAVFLILFMG